MAFSVINYVLSKNIVEETADGLGAVKGSPCTISSTKDVDEGVLVTFKWTGISGETETRTILVPKGKDGETPDLSSYATKKYVESALAELDVDLSDYYTKQEVDTLIKAISSAGGSGGSGSIPLLIGTISNTIIVSELEAGTYLVTGQYKISQSDTLRMTLGQDLFVVSKNTVQQIDSNKIHKYVINDGVTSEYEYLTSAVLESYVKKDELPDSIMDVLSEMYATEDDIRNLFK